MYTIDRKLFLTAMKDKGFKSVKALAKNLSLHRNTINYYLSGREVISRNLEKVLDALALTPQNIFVKTGEAKMPQENIAHFIDELHAEFPDLSFVLFGSHVQKRAHKYSDYDIGVFASGGIDHALYSEVLSVKSDLEENIPFFVDLINLNRADSSFLKNIRKSWVFLTGKQGDWVELNRRALRDEDRE